MESKNNLISNTCSRIARWPYAKDGFVVYLISLAEECKHPANLIDVLP